MSCFGVGLRLDVRLIFLVVFRIPLCLCEVVSTPSLPGFRCVPITPECGARAGCPRPAGGRAPVTLRTLAGRGHNRSAPAGQRHGGCRESDAGTGPAGAQQVALTAAFRSSTV